MMIVAAGSGAKKTKKTVCRISALLLEEVDVILYDFTLTKSGHLRKSMITVIKEKLQLTSGRQTRSKPYNPANIGLHLDEDDALINSSRED